MLNSRAKRLLDEGAQPANPEQLLYVLDRIVRLYIELTATDNGSVRDVTTYMTALGVVDTLRHSVARDYLDKVVKLDD